jgi:hypothetical protein
MGRKSRYLVVDRLHGAEIETREHEVLSDAAFETFSSALIQHAAGASSTARAEEDDRETAFAQKIATAAAASAGSPSVADEIAKLAALRDQGALTDDEFVTMKTKLMA